VTKPIFNKKDFTRKKRRWIRFWGIFGALAFSTGITLLFVSRLRFYIYIWGILLLIVGIVSITISIIQLLKYA